MCIGGWVLPVNASIDNNLKINFSFTSASFFCKKSFEDFVLFILFPIRIIQVVSHLIIYLELLKICLSILEKRGIVSSIPLSIFSKNKNSNKHA